MSIFVAGATQAGHEVGVLVPALDLSHLQTFVIQAIVGPLFLIVVAGVALKCLVKKNFREMVGFLALAVIAAVLIYAGPQFFGSGGSLTTAGKDVASNVNVVLPVLLGF